MSEARDPTVRELIERFIPGADLSTESAVIIAIEACKILILQRTVPDDEYSRAFMEFYNTTWMDHF